jgi:hypothetical protein
VRGDDQSVDRTLNRQARRAAVFLLGTVVSILVTVGQLPQPAFAGTATWSPSTYDFGRLKVGSTSASKTFTVTNHGPKAITVTSSASASGDFLVTSNGCLSGRTLDIGASCSVSVAFRPTVKGGRTGTLSISTTAGGPSSAKLSGTGTIPVASVSPSGLSFGSLRPGQTSGAKSATLTNVGTAIMIISSISVTGPFAMSETCGSTLPPGSSCAMTVTFHPQNAGTQSGYVSISTDGGRPTVSLSGVGVAPAIKVDVSSLTFGEQPVGFASPPKLISLTNIGSDRLFITRLATEGDFKQTNTCQPYINVGITCTVSITFGPKDTGARTGRVVIEGDLDIHDIKLSGVGIPPPPGFTPSQIPPNGGSGAGLPSEGSGEGLPGFVKYGGPIGGILILAALLMGGLSRRRTKSPASAIPPDGEAVSAPSGNGKVRSAGHNEETGTALETAAFETAAPETAASGTVALQTVAMDALVGSREDRIASTKHPGVDVSAARKAILEEVQSHGMDLSGGIEVAESNSVMVTFVAPVKDLRLRGSGQEGQSLSDSGDASTASSSLYITIRPSNLGVGGWQAAIELVGMSSGATAIGVSGWTTDQWDQAVGQRLSAEALQDPLTRKELRKYLPRSMKEAVRQALTRLAESREA